MVDGDHDAVVSADHTYDPWHDSSQDPEWDREPTADVEDRSDTTERRD